MQTNTIATEIRQESMFVRQCKKERQELLAWARAFHRRANAIAKGEVSPHEGEKVPDLRWEASKMAYEAKEVQSCIADGVRRRRCLTLAAALLHDRRYSACEAKSGVQNQLTKRDYAQIGDLIQASLPTEDAPTLVRMWHRYGMTCQEILDKTMSLLLEIELANKEIEQATSAVHAAERGLKGHTLQIIRLQKEEQRLKRHMEDEISAREVAERELKKRRARVELLKTELAALLAAHPG